MLVINSILYHKWIDINIITFYHELKQVGHQGKDDPVCSQT